MMGTGDFATTLTLLEVCRLAGSVRLTASPQECADIAARLGLIAIAGLTADLSLAADGDAVAATGYVRAQVTQSCIATAEPITDAISTPVLVRFVPMATLEAEEEGAEIELASVELDVIGYDDGQIDVGAMAVDTLALALNPYPRRADADAWLRQHGVQMPEEAGAFGALAALRDKLTK